jgi:hypothetical protein
VVALVEYPLDSTQVLQVAAVAAVLRFKVLQYRLVNSMQSLSEPQ